MLIELHATYKLMVVEVGFSEMLCDACDIYICDIFWEGLLFLYYISC